MFPEIGFKHHCFIAAKFNPLLDFYHNVITKADYVT